MRIDLGQRVLDDMKNLLAENARLRASVSHLENHAALLERIARNAYHLHRIAASAASEAKKARKK